MCVCTAVRIHAYTHLITDTISAHTRTNHAVHSVNTYEWYMLMYSKYLNIVNAYEWNKRRLICIVNTYI